MTTPVHTIVDSRVRFPVDAVRPECLEQLHSAFRHSNPSYHKQKAMGHYPKEGPHIETWRHIQPGTDGVWWASFPRGGMNRVRAALHEHGHPLRIEDRRTLGADLGTYTGDYLTPTLFPEHLVDPWEHQTRLVDAIIPRQNCLVRAPTGSGKSTALIRLIAQLQLPTIVIVWDTKLMIQWQERISAELGVSRKSIGIIKGQKRTLAPVTIAMQQTLNKFGPDDWAQVAPAFGLVACDEVQRYSASTFQSTIDMFPAKYRVGVSADESRKDQKEFLIYDMFGPVACEISKRELEQKGVIHNVQIRVVPTEFRADWYVTQRKTKGATPDFKALLDAMVDDDRRNEQIFSLVQRVSAEDPTFVFSHRVGHARMIDSAMVASRVTSGLLVGGEANTAEFERSKAGIRAGEIQVGVGTYQAIGVGQDVPNVAIGVCTTPMHTNRQFQDQVKGRICRKHEGKTRAIMYYMWDQHVHGHAALKNLCRWNKRVTVWHGSQWVTAADYMEMTKNAENENNGSPDARDAGIFA